MNLIAQIEKPIQKFVTNNSYKLLSETSSKTILNNCYQSIPNISYELLSDKPFQIILANYYQTTQYKLLLEKSLQTIPTNYYQKMISNHVYIWWYICKHYKISKVGLAILQHYMHEMVKKYPKKHYTKNQSVASLKPLGLKKLLSEGFAN